MNDMATPETAIAATSDRIMMTLAQEPPLRTTIARTIAPMLLDTMTELNSIVLITDTTMKGILARLLHPQPFQFFAAPPYNVITRTIKIASIMMTVGEIKIDLMAETGTTTNVVTRTNGEAMIDASVSTWVTAEVATMEILDPTPTRMTEESIKTDIGHRTTMKEEIALNRRRPATTVHLPLIGTKIVPPKITHHDRQNPDMNRPQIRRKVVLGCDRRKRHPTNFPASV